MTDAQTLSKIHQHAETEKDTKETDTTGDQKPAVSTHTSDSNDSKNGGMNGKDKKNARNVSVVGCVLRPAWTQGVSRVELSALLSCSNETLTDIAAAARIASKRPLYVFFCDPVFPGRGCLMQDQKANGTEDRGAIEEKDLFEQTNGLISLPSPGEWAYLLPLIGGRALVYRGLHLLNEDAWGGKPVAEVPMFDALALPHPFLWETLTKRALASRTVRKEGTESLHQEEEAEEDSSQRLQILRKHLRQSLSILLQQIMQPRAPEFVVFAIDSLLKHTDSLPPTTIFHELIGLLEDIRREHPKQTGSTPETAEKTEENLPIQLIFTYREPKRIAVEHAFSTFEKAVEDFNVASNESDVGKKRRIVSLKDSKLLSRGTLKPWAPRKGVRRVKPNVKSEIENG